MARSDGPLEHTLVMATVLPAMTADDLKDNDELRTKAKKVADAYTNYEQAQKVTTRMLCYRDREDEKFSEKKLEQAEQLEYRMLAGVAKASNVLFKAWVAECRSRN